MSTVISRRSFLKCTGASAAALGAASLLGGCKSNGNDTVVEVKVGDTVRNWNGLGVQLTSVFRECLFISKPRGKIIFWKKCNAYTVPRFPHFGKRRFFVAAANA